MKKLTVEAIEKWRKSLRGLESAATAMGIPGEREADALCDLALSALTPKESGQPVSGNLSDEWIENERLHIRRALQRADYGSEALDLICAQAKQANHTGAGNEALEIVKRLEKGEPEYEGFWKDLEDLKKLLNSPIQQDLEVRYQDVVREINEIHIARIIEQREVTDLKAAFSAMHKTSKEALAFLEDEVEMQSHLVQLNGPDCKAIKHWPTQGAGSCDCGANEYNVERQRNIDQLKSVLTAPIPPQGDQAALREAANALVGACEKYFIMKIECEYCDGVGTVDLSLGDVPGMHSNKEAKCMDCHGEGEVNNNEEEIPRMIHALKAALATTAPSKDGAA